MINSNETNLNYHKENITDIDKNNCNVSDNNIITETCSDIVNTNNNNEQNTINKKENVENAIGKDGAEEKKHKQLAFWVGLLCSLIVIIEVTLNAFGVNFEIKLAVEIISYILAFLVSIGVLKSNKPSKNVGEIKEDIENEILSSTNNKTKTEQKNKD